MRKIALALLLILTLSISTSVFAGGWKVERWVTEDGFEDFRIVDTNEPDLTDQQVRDMEADAKALRSSDYYDFDVVREGPFDMELKQRGTGKIIIIHKQ